MKISVLKKILTVFIYISFFSLSGAVDCTASEAAENVSRIQNFYRTVKDMKGSFIQKNTIKDLDRTDVYSGRFLIKYPLKMRWMYKGKTPQEIIISGGTVIIYKKGDSQAYKGKFDSSTYGQSPVALLSGFEDITKSFNITGGGNSLILKPENPSG
ncbi:MAG: outer membrane lipoprotein carrier protein LolA, partial [Nitrospirota bacterium]|nr:outer membrane lipoprotein carrier protein LolA [Nitrospirota bacterium]